MIHLQIPLLLPPVLLLKSLLNVWWLCIFSCYKVKDCTSFKDFFSCVLLWLSLTFEIHILLEYFFARIIQKLVFSFCLSCTSNYLWRLKQINCLHIISKRKSFVCLKYIPSFLTGKKLIRIFQGEENNAQVRSFLMHCLPYTIHCSEVFRPPASHIVFRVQIVSHEANYLEVHYFAQSLSANSWHCLEHRMMAFLSFSVHSLHIQPINWCYNTFASYKLCLPNT
jgi:hypothetical protein